MATTRLMARSDKVAFMAVPGTTETIQRMIGFSALSIDKNPTEYSRQYVDEAFEQTDVTAINTSMGFGFDYYVGNEVHDYIAEIIDSEKIGSDAVVTIYTVDFTKPHETAANTYQCSKRDFAVIASTEGDTMEAYTYSGDFRTKGGREVGWAETDGAQQAQVQTITFSTTIP